MNRKYKKSAYLPDVIRYTPISGKKIPIISEGWQNKPLEWLEAWNWHEFATTREGAEYRKKVQGIGILCGSHSGGLLCVDFDGPEAWETYELLVGSGEVPETLTWSSGKQDRCQMAFWVPKEYWDDLNTVKVGLAPDAKKCLEFRWNGQQSVIPPSVHPETGSYNWITETDIQPIPEAMLAFWLKRCLEYQAKSEDTGLTWVPAPELAPQALAELKSHYPSLGYDDWRNVTWAMMKECGAAEGILHMKGAYPEQKAGEYKSLQSGWNVSKSPSLGTILYFIKLKNPDSPLLKRQKIEDTDQYIRLRNREIEQRRLIDPPEQKTWSVQAIDGACGSGKTHSMLMRILKQGGKWVYAVDKINPTMDERVKEFLDLKRTFGADWWVKKAHSKLKADGTIDQEFARVGGQINAAYTEFEAEPGKNCILFITHAALLLMNWGIWAEYNLVIDEVVDPIITGSINAMDNGDLLRRVVEPIEEDGDSYILSLTRTGEELASNPTPDDYDRNHYPLVVAAKSRNTRVGVSKDSWDNMASQRVEWWCLIPPDLVENFRSVTLLGDELMKMPIKRYWSDVCGVKFEQPAWWRPRSPRTPHAERARIYYFSEHQNASMYRFKEKGDNPLGDIAAFFKGLGIEPLWTTNRDFIEGVKEGGIGDDYIRPKAHGINELMDRRYLAWLATMRGNPVEAKTIRDLIGMTMAELALTREMNALYQFVMRGRLRDFGGSDECHLFVFSKDQAKYLAERFGVPEDDLVRVEGVVEDEPTKTGRPKKWRDRGEANYVATLKRRNPTMTDEEIQIRVDERWQKKCAGQPIEIIESGVSETSLSKIGGEVSLTPQKAPQKAPQIEVSETQKILDISHTEEEIRTTHNPSNWLPTGRRIRTPDEFEPKLKGLDGGVLGIWARVKRRG